MYDGTCLNFGLFGATRGSLENSKNKISAAFGNKITLSFTENLGISHVKIEYLPDTDKKSVDEVAKAFVGAFSGEIYTDDDKSPLAALFDLLKVRRLIISCAESFTGGAVAKSITSVPGASEVFFEGLVCYNTEAKIKRLGVERRTIEEKTVVSSEVAFQMARGLLKSGDCDVACATTGYASPTGERDKPCGLCYIAAGAFGKVNVVKYEFKGSREEIAEQGKNAALFAAIKILKNS